VKKQKENLSSEAENVPECSDFVSYARIRESSLSGNDLAYLATETANIYSTLGVQLTILRDLLKKDYHESTKGRKRERGKHTRKHENR